MKHNPHNFKEGDTVILDEKYNNKSLVKILHITTTGLMSCVAPAELEPPYEKGDYWDVMTNRLSPIKQKDNETNKRDA